jgi:predicted O-methyltransferase YrrM
MAYHGYIPSIKQFLSQIQSPKVLEIGLCKGITTIPLLAFMSRMHENFEFVGVDVLVQESLLIILNNIDVLPSQKMIIHQDSSLNALPKLTESSKKFDVVLLDGDHNYYTVSRELEYLDSLTNENSIVLIDDYHGRWSERDLWYAEKEGYESADKATKRIDTEKHGVKPAVDDFLMKNSNWELLTPIPGEPVMLRRKKDLGMFNGSLFNT